MCVRRRAESLAPAPVVYTIELDGDSLRMVTVDPPFLPGREWRPVLQRELNDGDSFLWPAGRNGFEITDGVRLVRKLQSAIWRVQIDQQKLIADEHDHDASGRIEPEAGQIHASG